MDNKALINRVAQRTEHDETTATGIVDAALEEIESVSPRNFGTFYVRPKRSSTVFRFTPSQRLLRKLFGWSSTYKDEV